MQCPNCQSDNVEFMAPYKGRHVPFDKLSLAKCGGCSLVFAYPMLNDHDLSGYYKNYWAGDVAISTPSTRRYYMAQSLSRVQYLNQFMGPGKALENVLDMGAGLGLFYDAMREMGWQSNYFAVEPDRQQFMALQRKHDSSHVFSCLKDIPENIKFDMIILAHVLEHVPRLHEFLGELTRYLKPGGILFVEVPNQDYRYKDLYESHVYFFGPQSLQAALARHGKILQVSTVGKKTDELHIQYVHPQRGLVLFIKESVKTILAWFTPNVIRQQIAKYYMDVYGDDRQWLRAAIMI
jgi:SAM-dependent methyltransferase